ncbi:MAG TPA: DUF4159 domain-containing protein [Candidatus Cloacimonetes bacterium]|nr:DUF4159 domain-containing protein [Candidatus Cloacimonadota bacterium]
MKKVKIFLLVLIFLIPLYLSGEMELTIARVQYDGGGDWYNNTSVIPNLCDEINSRTLIKASPEQAIVSLKNNSILNHPFLYLTGHGNISFSEEECTNLRNYLEKGGFLYVDDDYGLNEYFRREFAKVFPEKELQELPATFPIFDCYYTFSNGLPKVHEHDGKRPQAFGLFDDYGRLMVLYTYETNISDGWASPEVHKDPPHIREQAFKMGINIVFYVLTH